MSNLQALIEEAARRGHHVSVAIDPNRDRNRWIVMLGFDSYDTHDPASVLAGLLGAPQEGIIYIECPRHSPVSVIEKGIDQIRQTYHIDKYRIIAKDRCGAREAIEEMASSRGVDVEFLPVYNKYRQAGGHYYVQAKLVQKCTHILLVLRGDMPGQGKLRQRIGNLKGIAVKYGKPLMEV